LANLGLIYTNYLGGILILGQAVMIPFTFPKERRVWWRWLVGQGIMVLGFLPWVWVMAKQAVRGNIAYEVAKAPAPLFALIITKMKSIILKIAYTAYVFFIGETTFPWKLVITVPVVIVVIVGMMMILMRRKTPVPRFRVLLGYAVGSLLVVVVLSELYARIFSFQSFALLPSRLLPLVPVFLVVLVFGLYSVRHTFLKTLLIVLFLIGEAYGTWHYYAQDEYLNPKYGVSWQSVVQFIKEKSAYTGFSCTDESSFLYYNKILGGPPAYGVMDLPQGFREVGGTEGTLSLWVISRYRGDPGIRHAYDELIAFCRETFAVAVDTGFSQVDPTLSRFLTRVTGDAAPDRIVSVIQYLVPFGAMGLDGMETAMGRFINSSPIRKQTLGWINDDPASDIIRPKSKTDK
jgi:hypothetical protein